MSISKPLALFKSTVFLRILLESY